MVAFQTWYNSTIEKLSDLFWNQVRIWKFDSSLNLSGAQTLKSRGT